MKKLLLLAAVLLTAVSCEKHRGDELYMISKELDVKAQDWGLNYDSDYVIEYYYTFRAPEISRRVCDIGEVSATCYMDNDAQSLLPETLYFDDYAQTIRFQYDVGEITFFVTYMSLNVSGFEDWQYDDLHPGHLWFRMVVNY